MKFIIVALLALLPVVALAAAPQPMSVVSERYQFNTVEQWGHPINNSGCTFDPDDTASIVAEGILPSTGFTMETCAIFDHMNDPVLGIDFRARKPFTATVQIVNESGTHTLTYQSVRDGNTQRIKKCFTGPRYDGDVVFPPVVGVDGGYGYRTSLVWTMQPIGTRDVRDSIMYAALIPDSSFSTPDLCGTYYTIGNPWPNCEGDPFTNGQLCYQD